MSTMRERLSTEFSQFDDATEALENAFSYDEAHAYLPGELAELWADGAYAALRVVRAAHILSDAAGVIARRLEEGQG